MIKNLSKKNYSKKSVETFYTKIQIKAEKDSNSGNEPYQYKEFNKYFYENLRKKFKDSFKTPCSRAPSPKFATKILFSFLIFVIKSEDLFCT